MYLSVTVGVRQSLLVLALGLYQVSLSISYSYQSFMIQSSNFEMCGTPTD